MAYSFQKFEFSFYYIATVFFALNDVIHVRTLRNINDDVAAQ